MTKAEIYKLTPGTFLEVRWNDASNSVVLLLEKPERQRGDVSLKCLHQTTGLVDTHIVHGQVVAVCGQMAWPSSEAQYTYTLK